MWTNSDSSESFLDCVGDHQQFYFKFVEISWIYHNQILNCKYVWSILWLVEGLSRLKPTVSSQLTILPGFRFTHSSLWMRLLWGWCLDKQGSIEFATANWIENQSYWYPLNKPTHIFSCSALSKFLFVHRNDKQCNHNGIQQSILGFLHPLCARASTLYWPFPACHSFSAQAESILPK